MQERHGRGFQGSWWFWLTRWWSGDSKSREEGRNPCKSAFSAVETDNSLPPCQRSLFSPWLCLSSLKVTSSGVFLTAWLPWPWTSWPFLRGLPLARVMSVFRDVGTYGEEQLLLVRIWRCWRWVVSAESNSALNWHTYPQVSSLQITHLSSLFPPIHFPSFHFLCKYW